MKRQLLEPDELTGKAREAMLEEYRYFNVDHDWWYFTYEDAERVGLKITGFGLDNSYDYEITGALNQSIDQSIKAILADHGASCETYQIAKRYYEEWRIVAITAKLTGGDDDTDEALVEITGRYEESLLHAYWTMLKNDYEYLTSDEQVIESLEANEFRFDKMGRRSDVKINSRKQAARPVERQIA